VKRGKRFDEFKPGQWLASVGTGVLGLKVSETRIAWVVEGGVRFNTGPIDQQRQYLEPAEVKVEVLF
jgi:hypothetical protein